MNLFTIHGKFGFLAVCWAMLTIAMPGLAALTYQRGTEGDRQRESRLTLAFASSECVAFHESNQESEQNENRAAAFENCVPNFDLFVIAVEKQVLSIICHEFLDCAVTQNPGNHDYQDLVVQLPAKPTLRRLEIMFQV